MTKELYIVALNSPDNFEKYGGVILEITDGQKVILQFKTDGVLYLSGIRIKTVNELVSYQELYDVSESSSIGEQIKAGVEQRTD